MDKSELHTGLRVTMKRQSTIYKVYDLSLLASDDVVGMVKYGQTASDGIRYEPASKVQAAPALVTGR